MREEPEADASRAQYEFWLRATSDGVIVADPAGLVVSINPAGLAMLGQSAEQIIGQPAERIFNKHPGLVNLFKRTGEQTLDVRLPRRRLAVGVGNTLADGGRMVILQDVTERRNLDERRDSLIDAISHDLKNPINAINGFAELVGKFGDLNEQQQRFIDRIDQTSTRLYLQIKRMVDLAWLEAGMPLEHRPLQLRDVIERAIAEAEPVAHEREIIIATALQDPLPLVMGDPARLQQAIYNLLHNAVIYSQPQQVIVIHSWGDEQDVYCSVADRGAGIPDDEIDLIFARLYRGRSGMEMDASGGGLGLTMTRIIIKRHGGDIWVSSNLGTGSQFTFVLPAMAEN